MHDDLGIRERRRQVTDTASMVEVDMRDHDGGEVIWADAQVGEGFHHRVGTTRGAGFDDARLTTADAVTGRDAVVATHPGVDHVDVVTQLGHGVHTVFSPWPPSTFVDSTGLIGHRAVILHTCPKTTCS